MKTKKGKYVEGTVDEINALFSGKQGQMNTARKAHIICGAFSNISEFSYVNGTPGDLVIDIKDGELNSWKEIVRAVNSHKELVNIINHLLNQPELITDDFYRKQIKEYLSKAEANG